MKLKYFTEEAYNYLYDNFPTLDLVILRNEENIGPAQARNKGLEKALALNIPFIMFADADDQFTSPLSVQLLYNTLIVNKSDLVCSSFYEEGPDEDPLMIHEDYDIWLFGKIYRASIIESYDIRFPALSMNEDVCFNLWYWLASNNKNFIKEITYLWKNNKNSITRKDNSAYTWSCFSPLCENLIAVYKAMIESDKIQEEKMIFSLANRIIRLYGAYNTACYTKDDRINLEEMRESLSKFNQEILMPYWKLLNEEAIMSAWQEMVSQEPNNQYPAIGLREFIRMIKGE